MPGRLRQGEGLSDKAQGCCLKCCEATCRVSPWNKLLCYSVILLVVATLIILIGGAFIRDPTANGMCSASNITIPPPIQENIYGWYLANTGIIVTVLVAMTAVCCFSYVGLCCGLNLPKVVKILAVIGFVLLALGMAIYIAWMVLGAWLISTMEGSRVAFEGTCRRIIAYVIFLIMYIIVLIGVTVASCIWAAHGGAKEDESKKARPSKKSQLKMPPVSII